MNNSIYFSHIVFSILLLFTGVSIHAQNVAVTFQVDMGNEVISPSGVHIAGNFQSEAGFGDDWMPGATLMSDADGDQVYTITVNIPPATYQYKFINGNDWGMDENPSGECSVGDTNNRVVTVGNADLVLPPVSFNGCLERVRFSVNMSGQSISSDGVHVMGNFQQAAGYDQNWDPTSIKLEDINGDKTYDIELTLPDGNYQYLFVNGEDLLEAETLPLDCSVAGENGTNNRTLTVAAGTPDPLIYCFNSCEECDPTINADYETYWWNDAVFYELFVRSFYDSDGDGIGDFQGAIEKLDYLNDGNPETDSDLGITALWLMPMMESPSYHGYDVTDYYGTEPDYGTMADFEEFLEEAHARGIKVIIDLVLNHSSNQHPWFTQSANNTNDFRDWYIWSDTHPGVTGPWGQNVWHNYGDDFYYGLFWGGMPDLNYNHLPVKEEMFEVVNFWLDKGVDGFRLDAIKYLIEDGNMLENTPATFSLLEEFNEVYKSNNPEAFTIGEVWSNTASVIPYVQNDRLDVCFEFDLAGSILNAVNNGNPNGIEQKMQELLASYPALQYGTFLTNHDMDRVYNQLGFNTNKIKLAASIYLTLPGIPFLYYGEEVNMVGAGIHENIRRPMQWSDGVHAGFSTTSPWYGVGANYEINNVATMGADPNSLLNHYKKLIHIRNQQVALRRGNFLSVESSLDEVYGFTRIYENEGVVVVSNLSTQNANASLTLTASGLMPGNYFITDLYNNQEAGTITINQEGGFDNWQPSPNGLSSQTTGLYLITEENPVNTIHRELTGLNFQLFPNPTSDYFRVQLEGEQIQQGQVTVFSANGVPVHISAFNSGALIISTNNWQRGVYFVEVSTNGYRSVKRLIVL